jgi:outer membrane immunogenic protein
MHRKIIMASAAAACFMFCAPAMASSSGGHFGGVNMGVDIGWAHVFGQIDDVNPNYADNSGFQDVDSADGIVLGARLGYDWLFANQWLFGLEIGAQDINAESAGCGASGCRDGAEGNPNLAYDVKGVATFRARFGYIFNPDTMVYVGGGFAVAEVQTHHHDDEEYDGQTRNFTGYSINGGFQRALNDSTDLRLDVAYEHYSAKHWTDMADEDFGARPEVLTVTLGAVWHLN